MRKDKRVSSKLFTIYTIIQVLQPSVNQIHVSSPLYFPRGFRRGLVLYASNTPAHFTTSLIAAMPAMILLKPYIHLNPIRANMITELCSYRFSSYPAFTGQAKAQNGCFLYSSRAAGVPPKIIVILLKKLTSPILKILPRI